MTEGGKGRRVVWLAFLKEEECMRDFRGGREGVPIKVVFGFRCWRQRKKET